MTRLWYETLWCNMLWYDVYMMKCYVKSIERYVRSLKNCVYTAWYEWHEITINIMKYNPIRIMYDLRTEEWEMIWHEWWTISETIWKMIWYVHNASRVVLKDNENGKVLGPHALCVLMHLVGIPLSHHECMDAYIQWHDNDRYALHSAAVTVTSSTECLA